MRKCCVYCLLKKSVHGLFNIAIRKAWFSNGSHFQWLAAIKKGGTSLHRELTTRNRSFSVARLNFAEPPVPDAVALA